MRVDKYIKIDSLRFEATKIRFSGIGSNEIIALGEFQAERSMNFLI